MKKINFITAALALCCFATSAFADIQTLTLNTGFNHNANQAYSLTAPMKDSFWAVIYDQANVPTRSSDLMQNHPAWQPALPDSQWISFAPGGVPVSNGKPSRVYVFEKCFCLKEGFNRKENIDATKLQINLRVDDWAAVYLNESLLNILGSPNPPPAYPHPYYTTPAPFAFFTTTTSGGFSSTVPATATLQGGDLIKRLRVGRNCLQVRLLDLRLVVSGFNLTGSITAAGIDGVASTENPKNPFNQCSSCGGGKRFNEADSNIRVTNN